MTFLPLEEPEHCADILDVATQVSMAHVDSGVAHSSFLAQPEHDGSVTECVDCGCDNSERAAIGRARCIRCQTIVEKKRSGYGLG